MQGILIWILQSETEVEPALNTNSKRGSVRLVDQDGDSSMDSDEESDTTTTGAPPVASEATSASSRAINIDTSNNEATSSPIPPSFTSIGSPEVPTHQELQTLKGMLPERTGTSTKQLETKPGGDAFSGAAKVEGMLDTSESPLRL